MIIQQNVLSKEASQIMSDRNTVILLLKMCITYHILGDERGTIFCIEYPFQTRN